MEMENYKPNSFKSREENERSANEKKVQKIVNGPIKTKKKNGLQKFAQSFILEDLSKVKEDVINDVIVPSIKKTISDIIKNGIDTLFYGKDARNRNTGIAANKVSYRNYYDNSSGVRTVNTRSTYAYDDIILASRGEAELVLSQMEDVISRYQFISVADLYELVGLRGSYTDNNYGWINLQSAKIISVQEGFLLKLPRAMPLER